MKKICKQNTKSKTIINSKLYLPTKLIAIDTDTERFIFQFIEFDENQNDYSIKIGGVTGKFGIEYTCNGIKSNFACDITVGNVYKFYHDLKICYRNLNGVAILRDYSGERTNLAIIFEDYGKCLIKGSFSNKYSLYRNGINFLINCNQTFIKSMLYNFEIFFSELARLQGDDKFLY